MAANGELRIMTRFYNITNYFDEEIGFRNPQFRMSTRWTIKHNIYIYHRLETKQQYMFLMQLILKLTLIKWYIILKYRFLKRT